MFIIFLQVSQNNRLITLSFHYNLATVSCHAQAFLLHMKVAKDLPKGTTEIEATVYLTFVHISTIMQVDLHQQCIL